MSNGLRIVGVAIRPPTPVTEEEAAHNVPERQHLDVQVENTGSAPVHVWTGLRGYTYDSATNVLEVFLSEPGDVTPPGIELISDHPRVPPQVVVDAGGQTTIDVPVSTVIRRRVPGTGLGMSYVEEPIDDIQQVTLHVQYADVPFQAVVGESPQQLRRRMQSHGQTVDATVTPTNR
jgi:hypothetical protein